MGVQLYRVPFRFVQSCAPGGVGAGIASLAIVDCVYTRCAPARPRCRARVKGKRLIELGSMKRDDVERERERASIA